jgi:uncharacterized protein
MMFDRSKSEGEKRKEASGWRASVVAYVRAEAQPQDKFGHQPRLYALAERIAAESAGKELAAECDDDVLFAAAWMHDLGVFVGHRPSDPVALAVWDHVPYTVTKSAELLRGWGFPETKLAAVAEAIRTHQAKDDAISPEAVVLRDSDILEQLGAVGALRAIVKVGRDTRYATYSDVLPVLRRALEQLPSQLRLEASRRLAVERIAALRGLLLAIEAEAGDLLF